MKLIYLENAVRQHTGEFLCERINDRQITKHVQFAHVVTPPLVTSNLPALGRLQDFYDTFGSVVFYSDEKSGDAAKHLAPTSEWAGLHEYFNGWIENLSDAERQELVPDWIDTCLVIGETPCSGNYILMGTEGPAAGRVFEFDHDGFEFSEVAQDLIEYVEKLLKPDGPRLVEFASHMRFIEEDRMVQWWIRELKDHQGHIVTTNA